MARALGYGVGTPFVTRGGGGGGAPVDSSLKLDLDFTAMTTLDPRVTFTRAGPATHYGTNGLLRNAPHNYARNSTTPAVYTVTGGAVMTAGVIGPDGTATAASVTINPVANSYIYTAPVSTVAGSIYTWSVWLRGTGTVEIGMVEVSHRGVLVTLTSEWIRHSYTTLSTSGPIGQVFVGSNTNAGMPDTPTATAFDIWGPQLENNPSPSLYVPTAGSAAFGPRFDYNPVTLSPRGLLIEEQRINICLQSNAFATTWLLQAGLALTPAAITSPDGTSNGWKIARTTTNTTQTSLSQVIAGIANGSTYTWSVYAKAAEVSVITLTGYGETDTVFNLTNGTVQNNPSGRPTFITALPGGWYRVGCAITKSNATGTFYIFPAPSSQLEPGTAGQGIYIYGAQVELGAFPTSYIATTTASVTRPADRAEMTGTNFTSWYSGTTGTFLAEGQGTWTSFAQIIAAATSGTNTILGRNAASTTEVYTVRVGGTVTPHAITEPPGFDIRSSPYKVAVAYDPAGMALTGNGMAPTTNAATLLTTGIVAVAFGSRTAAFFMVGTIKRVQFYNTRKSNAELQTLTAPPVAPPALDLDFTTGTLDPRITFTRAGPATHYGSDGKLRTAPHNLFRGSSDFTIAGGYWSNGNITTTANDRIAPDGTQTADKISPWAGSSTYVRQSITVNTATYTTSCYVYPDTAPWYAITAGPFNAWFNVVAKTVGTVQGSGTANITDVGGGWLRLQFTVGLTANGFIFDLTAVDANGSLTAGGTVWLWGAQLEQNLSASTYIPTTTAAVHGPRFDYDPVTLQPRGLLLEEQRTNISAPLTVPWASFPAGGTFAQNTTAAPDGTMTAGTFTGADATVWYQTLAVANATTYTWSVYFKKGTANFAILSINPGSGDVRAWINMTTGVLGTVTGMSNVTVVNAGNGWRRISGTVTTTGGVAYPAIAAADADNSTNCAGTTVHAWGAQLEIGAFATSYILTTTFAAVTRAADSATMTGTSFSSWYNQAAGSMVIEFVPPIAVSGYYPGAFNMSGPSGDRISAYHAGNTYTSMEVIKNAGLLSQLDYVQATLIPNGINRTARYFASNDYGLLLNGTGPVAVTTTGGAPPSDMNNMTIGHWYQGYFTGHYRRLTYYNTRKTNAELQALTAP